MKETEIRPKELYDQFLEIVNAEVKELFHDVQCSEVTCPACGNDASREAFTKLGFNYHECMDCRTVFVNPLPDPTSIDAYYRESKAVEFFAHKLYPLTKDVRKEKIFRPRATFISEMISEYNLDNYKVMDIGGAVGLLADELVVKKIPCEVIEPSIEQSKVCRSKGITVHNMLFEEFRIADGDSGIIFTSFELVEHLHNPRKFFDHAYNEMRAGDYFFFTTLSGTGLDLRVLWNKSSSFLPPLHLVFFNPYSIKKLLEELGFSILLIDTPGNLDVDILNNNSEYISDGFWKMFVDIASDEQKTAMQRWLQDNMFSSHMRVLMKK